jgi:hypothetical protein
LLVYKCTIVTTKRVAAANSSKRLAYLFQCHVAGAYVPAPSTHALTIDRVLFAQTKGTTVIAMPFYSKYHDWNTLVQHLIKHVVNKI